MRRSLVVPSILLSSLIALLSLSACSLAEPETQSTDCPLATCPDNQYFAGFAKVDISPRLGDLVPTMMAGPQMLEEIQDPLYAKALVISDGRNDIGVIAFDLLFLESTAGHELRQHLLDNTSLDQVIFTVTHTHSGVFDSENLEQLKTRALTATQMAMSQMHAVEIGASSVQVDEAYNRRIQYGSENGSKVEMLWVNPERKANRPVDTELGVIHLRTLAGAPVVSLINYSAHPTVTMDLNNVVVSADYPGALSRTITEE